MRTGNRVDKVSTSGSVTEMKTESDLKLINLATSIGKNLGIGFLRVTEDRTQTDSSISKNSTYDTTLTAITAGKRISLGFDLGFFYQTTSFKQTGMVLGSPINMEIDMPRLGAGVGLSSKTFHFEIGYVKNLDSISEDQGGDAGAGSNVAVYNPAKYTGTVEFKLGKLSLGVTSNYYMGGFFDYNNLVYYTRNKENHLENTFNF